MDSLTCGGRDPTGVFRNGSLSVGDEAIPRIARRAEDGLIHPSQRGDLKLPPPSPTRSLTFYLLFAPAPSSRRHLHIRSMAAATSSATPAQLNGFAKPPADKYRGAVLEVSTPGGFERRVLRRETYTFTCRYDAWTQDLQLPPAFALPADEAISRAIEMAYERDFSHIP